MGEIRVFGAELGPLSLAAIFQSPKFPDGLGARRVRLRPRPVRIWSAGTDEGRTAEHDPPASRCWSGSPGRDGSRRKTLQQAAMGWEDFALAEPEHLLLVRPFVRQRAGQIGYGQISPDRALGDRRDNARLAATCGHASVCFNP